jgi:iron complex transport system ATP-binding protein
MEPALMFDAATVRTRDGAILLGPVDLRVEHGQRWALLGPNGSGKTTLLGLAGGRRAPSGGRVDVLGGGFGRTDMRQLRTRIGHCSHRLAESMRGTMSAFEAVMTGRDAVLESWTLQPDDEDQARARSLLQTVGCLPLADRTLGTLSQGERQRVMLARALFRDPDLLLLDEPAAGLDLPSREQLIRALEAMPSQTWVLATHHLEELPGTATHALLLRDGAAVAAGPVEDALTAGSLEACFGVAVDLIRPNGRFAVVPLG